MEEIPYRSIKLTTQSIPKGTLLFRVVSNQLDDTRGVPLQDGTRCMIPNYNVFFYPNPFVAKIALRQWLGKTSTRSIYIYTLSRDVRVLRLVLPSKQSRSHKSQKRTFIKRCALVPKGCMPRSLAPYDPCLSDTIIKKYPDVVGMLGIAVGDAKRIHKAIKKKQTQRLLPYFHMAKDASGHTGIPELVLHPLIKRPSKNLIIQDSDILENNYTLLTKINIDEEDTLLMFMKKHAIYNPDTFFYNYTE